MKEFRSSDLICLKELIGKSVNDIFYQPVADILAYVDMFVVNFGEKAEISFHIFSFFRITNKSNILLTTTDCFFADNFERLTSEKENDERNRLYKGTLLHSNIERVKSILQDAKVSKAYSTDIGDVIIEFDNSVTMEVRIDALCNQECYRLIFYTENPPQHNVVMCNKGQIFFDKDTEA